MDRCYLHLKLDPLSIAAQNDLALTQPHDGGRDFQVRVHPRETSKVRPYADGRAHVILIINHASWQDHDPFAMMLAL